MSTEIISKFYQSFQNLDAEGMVSCYHKDIKFEDPAFGVLEGEHAGNMWRMLVESQKGKDFRVEFRDVRMEGAIGKAHWEAHYNFSKTGRRVHNIITATFRFQEDKIIQHLDQFDLHRWSRQALGMSGLLLGWTGFFQKKLNAQTNHLLKKWENKRALGDK